MASEWRARPGRAYPRHTQWHTPILNFKYQAIPSTKQVRRLRRLGCRKRPVELPGKSLGSYRNCSCPSRNSRRGPRLLSFQLRGLCHAAGMRLGIYLSFLGEGYATLMSIHHGLLAFLQVSSGIYISLVAGAVEISQRRSLCPKA